MIKEMQIACFNDNWDNTKIITKPTIQNIKCFFKRRSGEK